MKAERGMSPRATEILECINEAEKGVLTDAPNQVVTGFAGDKLTGLIQRLTKLIGRDYLEVGVFQGSSLLNTAYANPDIHCYGIDNFSQFDPENRNKSLVIERAEALNVTNYSLIDQDFEDGLLSQSGEIGVYFIDGPHDYRSQLLCLGYAVPFLAEGGVMLVDDANYVHVRQATADFLKMFPEYKLVFEAYTQCHPVNMNQATEDSARKGWWDGVHLIVHDPNDEFVGLTPPVSDNSRYIRDHVVHTARYAPVAAEAAMFLQAFTRPWTLPRAMARFAKARWERRSEIAGRSDHVNTESGDLPTRVSARR